jgi:hypothetical protein
MNEIQRMLIVDTMRESEDRISEITAKMLDLGFRVFDREEDESEVNVTVFLDEMKQIHEQGDVVLSDLEREVMNMSEEMQEWDFTGDKEYIAYHEGIYAHLNIILATVEEIIETCVVIDHEATLRWAYDNDMVDEGEGE